MLSKNHSLSVLLFQKVVPTYRVPIFRKLYSELNIIVCHSRENKKGSWRSAVSEMDFPNELIGRFFYRNTETTLIQWPFGAIRRHRPKIVIAEFAAGYLTYWLLLLGRPFWGYKLVVWSHGIKNNEMDRPFRSLTRRFVLFGFRRSNAMVLYNEERAQLLRSFMPARIPIFVAHNTMDTSVHLALYNQLASLGKEAVKAELQFTAPFNIIYMGRLKATKRIDLALESFMLLEKHLDVAIHFIGEGPEAALIEQYKTRSSRIFYHGGIYKPEEVGKFLFSSDLFIMPGYIGLGAVHAFCFGLPVVTCQRTAQGPFHSPEFVYLHNSENSLICTSHAADIAQRMLQLLQNPEELQRLSDNALNTAKNECNVERMVSGFKILVSSLQPSSNSEE